MADVVVRVGASLKGDVGALYKPLVDGARRANERIKAELEAAEEKKYRDALKYIDRTEKAAIAAAKRKKKAEEDAAKEAADAWDKSVKRISSNALQNMRGIAGIARNAFGGILRGMGVNFDVGASVQSAVQNQKGAVTLAHKGFQEGAEGAAGQRQNPADLLREAGAAADKTGKSVGEMLDAMTAFTETSGDLEVARKMIVDIGKVSNATGAEMRTLGEVAGRLDFKLQGSVKDAGKRQEIIQDTLRVFAAQGKTGAIDVEQLAPQLTKLAAVAGRLSGGMAEAFQTVGIMAQIAPQGGAANPAIAARSVSAIVESMAKSQTGMLGDKRGAKSGVQIPVFADESRTTLRNPLEVVAEMVVKTKGDLAKMSQLMPNIRGAAIGVALQSTYTKAGGGAAGEDAIRQQVDKLKRAVMTQQEVEKENADVMKTTAAKAQVFQNNLEQAAAAMVDKVAPAFEALAPKALALVSAFEGTIGWAAENPGKAIVMAIVGSIAKAAIGEQVGGALRGLLGGGGPAGGAGPGGGGGLLSTAGKALTVVATAIAIEKVGEMVIDSVANSKSAEENAQIARETEVMNTVNALHSKGRGVSPSMRDIAEGDRRLAELQAQLVGQRTAASTGSDQALLNWITNTKEYGADKLGAQAIVDLASEIAQLRTSLAQKKVQDVRVVNMMRGVGGAAVDAGARAAMEPPP